MAGPAGSTARTAASNHHPIPYLIFLGIHVGALAKLAGDEAVEAVELAEHSRPHEGRDAVLWRRGRGATRGERPAGAAGGEGGGRGSGGGWWGSTHLVRGLKVGAVGDEELEAVEIAVESRLNEGRLAVLRRRGGGATRDERRR